MNDKMKKISKGDRGSNPQAKIFTNRCNLKNIHMQNGGILLQAFMDFN